MREFSIERTGNIPKRPDQLTTAPQEQKVEVPIIQHVETDSEKNPWNVEISGNAQTSNADNQTVDKNKIVETKTDENGNIYSYNESGECIKSCDKDGNLLSQITYNSDGSKVEIYRDILEKDQINEDRYDSQGRKVYSKFLGTTHRYTYNDDGTSVEKDSDGWTAHYDEKGRQVSQTNENGEWSKTTYNEDGTRVVKDSNGWTTHYDEKDRQVSQTNKYGEWSKTTYNEDGTRVVKHSNGWTTHYDEKGRQVLETNEDGDWSKTTYNEDGTSVVKDSNGWTTHYDAKDRQVSQTNKYGYWSKTTYNDDGTRVETSSYGGNDRKITTFYPNGAHTEQYVNHRFRDDNCSFRFDKNGKVNQKDVEKYPENAYALNLISADELRQKYPQAARKLMIMDYQNHSKPIATYNKENKEIKYNNSDNAISAEIAPFGIKKDGNDAKFTINGKEYKLVNNTNSSINWLDRTVSFDTLTRVILSDNPGQQLVNLDGHFISTIAGQDPLPMKEPLYLQAKDGSVLGEINRYKHGNVCVLCIGNNKFPMDDVMSGNIPKEALNANPKNPFSL